MGFLDVGTCGPPYIRLCTSSRAKWRHIIGQAQTMKVGLYLASTARTRHACIGQHRSTGPGADSRVSRWLVQIYERVSTNRATTTGNWGEGPSNFWDREISNALVRAQLLKRQTSTFIENLWTAPECDEQSNWFSLKIFSSRIHVHYVNRPYHSFKNTGCGKKVSCCTVIDISKARQ